MIPSAIRVLAAFSLVALLSPLSHAQGWSEIGDAGSLPGEEQPAFGCGPLAGIAGSLGPLDSEDLYLIDIVDPEQFSISTSPVFGGSATFDTQLWLFSIDGLGVAANDDCPFDPGNGPGSCIAGIGPSGMNLLIQPGPYLIAITGFDNDPLSAMGPIFDQNPRDEITGPDGPGGPGFIEAWNGPGNSGDYNIQVNGAAFLVPPSPFEPGTKHTPSAVPCECQDCPDDDEGMVLDPVYLFSGEFYTDATDLRIKGRGFDFIWSRKFRSRFAMTSAQGHGWDYSYNIRIEQCGPSLMLFNGQSRSDIYLPESPFTWTRREFFQVITENPDSTYSVVFPDTGQWNFNPINGSPEDGKISSIIDRNGNTMTFEYDPLGLLETVTDTLNREIAVAFNVDGFIQSITDFSGRVVQYDYYDDGDSLGSAGDLKSVTTPSVTGTPAGNDFPSGKTTTYTYSTGFSDETLNHNLLTIKDPKGQQWLTNIYSNSDPNSLDYDRVIRQLWGDQDLLTGDILDVSYVALIPDFGNGFASTKAIVNDRVGHVKEFFYDDLNRGVMERIFTGSADPDQPTTDLTNRPVGKLRATDPDFFETRIEFNEDSLKTLVVHPNLNVETFLYDEGHADRRSQGNLLEHHYLPGPLGGDQVEIVEIFEYDDAFGGCCGSNFVASHIDGRGNETAHSYDSAGNRIQTVHRLPSIIEDFEYNAFGQLTAHRLADNGSGHRRRDEFVYFSGGASSGYRERSIIDSSGLALTTLYAYDSVGNIISMTDPKGNQRLYVVNSLDQVVRESSREVSPGGERYERDIYYDANDNVVREDIQNVDFEGAIGANSHFTTIYEYDLLNDLLVRCEESGSYVGIIPGPLDEPTCDGLPESEFQREVYEYDENKNRTLVRYGEAVNGNQASNEALTLYDERDLIFQTIRAPGDPAQSTLQLDYDGNGNRIRRCQGLEDSPRTTTFVYDGYDRMVTRVDAMGNVSDFGFDANGNQVIEFLDGELHDVPGTASNVRLTQILDEYDSMDRLIRCEKEYFDPQTQLPIDDGQSIAIYDYSDTSHLVRTTDDNGHETLNAYDTANRLSVVTDESGNTQTYLYDANSNVVSLSELERSDLGSPDEVYETDYLYDGLDRLIQTMDNVGNSQSFDYDSRGNRERMIDEKGQETRYAYDGVNRLLKVVSDLDGDGAFFNDVDDVLTVDSWDDSSRRTGSTDDNANETVYTYDSLNRRVLETWQDGTEFSYEYDVHDNVTSTIDAASNIVTYGYDALDRLDTKLVSPGPGVSPDTSFESFEYDGLSRMVRASDDDSTVTYSYDSMSNVTSETLNGEVVESVFDGVGNRESIIYPGGRQLSGTYDGLDRQWSLYDEDGTIATYNYIGPSRIERREYGNGTRTSYTYDGLANTSDDFGVRRIVGIKHTVVSDGSIVDERAFTWDPNGNKTSRKDILSGLEHRYVYDRLNRLCKSRMIQTQPMVRIRRVTNYDLDGAQNRLLVSGAFNAPEVSGAYTLDSGPGNFDFELNQYSSTPQGDRVHDLNGNVASIGLSSMLYDYRNRMVELEDSFGRVTTYAYDALGRRIRKTQASAETRYFYDGWQVCEEQGGSGETLATYVYRMDRVGEDGGESTQRVDEWISMQKNGKDYYFHADDLGNTMALSDAFGSIVERYEYDDFGRPQVDSAPKRADRSPSKVQNPYLFNGRRFDTESGLYLYRTRYLDPNAGRFTTRDTIGIWGDPLGLGNGTTYAGNNPWSLKDPYGRDAQDECQKAFERKKARLEKFVESWQELIIKDRRRTRDMDIGSIDFDLRVKRSGLSRAKSRARTRLVPIHIGFAITTLGIGNVITAYIVDGEFDKGDALMLEAERKGEIEKQKIRDRCEDNIRRDLKKTEIYKRERMEKLKAELANCPCKQD